MAFIGEVGLSGELRTVPQMPARLSEASKLGFQRVVIPKVELSDDLCPEDLQVIQVRSLREALAESLRS
jgi:DNA repair protein RadA/Sms